MDRYLTCDVEILDWSWRAVRSEEETLAGAPRWSRMLTFLSLSAREMARGDVLPEGPGGNRERRFWCGPVVKVEQNKQMVLGS